MGRRLLKHHGEFPGTPYGLFVEGHRRVAKLVPGSDWDRTDYYYTRRWQVIEEWYEEDVAEANKDDPVTTLKYQYVRGRRYIDAPSVRDEDTSGDGDCTDAKTDADPAQNTGDEHLYYCQDANFNVTALVDDYDGAVVERYMYSPYGEVTVLHGVRDSSGTDTSADEWDPRDAADSFANEILYCGYRFDTETGLYHVRHRYYHPPLGRWLSRDPVGYVNEISLYSYVASYPLGLRDPYGLAPGEGAAGSPGGTTLEVDIIAGPDLLDDGVPGYIFALKVGRFSYGGRYAQINRRRSWAIKRSGETDAFVDVAIDFLAIPPTSGGPGFGTRWGLHAERFRASGKEAYGSAMAKWKDIGYEPNEIIDLQSFSAADPKGYCLWVEFLSIEWYEVKEAKNIGPYDSGLASLTIGDNKLKSTRPPAVGIAPNPVTGKAKNQGSAVAGRKVGMWGSIYLYVMQDGKAHEHFWGDQQVPRAPSGGYIGAVLGSLMGATGGPSPWPEAPGQ